MNDSNEQQDVATEPSQKSPPSALAMIGGGLVVIVSAVIAFFATCYPVGMIGFEITEVPFIGIPPEHVEKSNQIFIFAYSVGGCAALLVGYLVYRAFRKHWGKA